MRTIEADAVITPEGRLTLEVPPAIQPGRHRVVLVIDEQPLAANSNLLQDFPVDDIGPWPENLSLRREDMYDDWGR